MYEELTQRVKRIYAAISATEETDMGKVNGVVINTNGFKMLLHDFREGMSQPEIDNIANMLIGNIANLRDHMETWASQNGYETGKVVKSIKNSPDLQIIMDLWNTEKHGYPLKREWSGKSPKLTNIDRVMRLETKPEPGSGVSLTLDTEGRPVVSGSGSGKVVITAEVVGRDGDNLGDLSDVYARAVNAWEELLGEFGVAL